MAEKLSLRILKCPMCGANLKAKNTTEAITCVYCGNSVVPITENSGTQSESTAGFNGIIKVEGIKTSSSALAYLEQFFEDYDWDAFSYAQTLSVSEIDKLAVSLKSSSADDKNTWFVSYKALYVPFTHKVEGCKKILTSVINEYKKGNLDAYSKFDAYKRVASMITANKNNIIANLIKITSKAEKYGASPEEISRLNDGIDSIRSIHITSSYNLIEDIPEIRMFNDEKNAKIAQALAERGIYAENEYRKAIALMGKNQYVPALNILLSLKGYCDTDALIEKIDKYFLLGDIVEIGGKLYLFKKANAKKEANTLCLYPTVNDSIADKPIIKNISKIITNYADILYYLDNTGKLRRYNLATNQNDVIYKKPLSGSNVYVYARKLYLLSSAQNESAATNEKRELIEICLMTGKVRTALTDIESVISYNDNKLIYKSAAKKKDSDGRYSSTTNIYNLEMNRVIEISSKKINVEGFINNAVVYTKASPNELNKNLYIRELVPDAKARLLEQNIYKFSGIFADKLFYFVGNSSNKSLININRDGSGRKELPLFIKDILFEQSGWVYFIRKAGFTSILCKSHIDGTMFTIIAGDVDRFIDIKNGYLYYINDSSKLVKVRMDGTNLQELCDDVQNVLSVKEDKIIFVSVDDRIKTSTLQQTSSAKIVKSIYAVNFNGSGKMKLAYNIHEAAEYDENTVYYTVSKDTQTSDGNNTIKLEVLYKLDVNTNTSNKLIKYNNTELVSGCYVATCVYGSYDCPEVWTLRRFRDNMLASSVFGRAFIRTYYAISPTIVKWFGDSVWFKKMWQGTLDRMVSRLQEKGVESTPYDDIVW